MSGAPKVIRFGSFEVDLGAGRLLKRGVKVRIRQQPFAVLAVLLEHSGEVVTREELRRSLWPENVFVDFESNLNTAIARLRQVLGDPAAHPHIIETLPRRGYRFIAPVEPRTEGADPGGRPAAAALESWNAIGAYLQRDASTAIRWERTRGLPVHRLAGRGKPGVYAFRSEVDEWWARARPTPPEQSTPAPGPPLPSVAVLPFENLSADPANDYFGAGLADEITTALTRIHGLRVTARTSSLAFGGTRHDVRQIGARLGVSTVVEGSVQRCGGRHRISAHLVDVRSGFHLWSENYDREADDIFAIQDDISRAIAETVGVRLAPPPPRMVRTDAYHCWLKGRYYQQCGTVHALAKSATYFEQAMALDPTFPQPCLGLAQLLDFSAAFGNLRPKNAAARGLPAIRKALELDGSLGEAFAVSGAYRAWMEYDWKGAEADFERALEFSPAAVYVHWSRAMALLVPNGRLEEAEREMECAIQLDPLSPLIHGQMAWLLFLTRRFAPALERIEMELAVRPGFGLAHALRGAILCRLGRVEDGLACCRRAIAIMGAAPQLSAAAATSLALLGRRAEARAILADLEAAARERYVTPVGLASVQAALGEGGSAFEWLARAVDERDPQLLHVGCRPVFDSLREDPRFAALLAKMHLA